MKKLLVVLGFMLFAFTDTSAQKGEETVKFKTSAKCGMCKKRIEKDLSLTKGVNEAKLNLDDKTVTIVYNSKKTSPAKLKATIADIGYDADEVVANQKSHDALPDCCQKTAKSHVD